MTRIEDLELGKAVSKRLREAGLRTAGDICAWNRRELGSIPGVGAKTIEKIAETLAEADLDLATDPLAPYECVREGRDAWDVKLSTFFLCESCVNEWTSGPFRGHAPLYDSAALAGTCQNCNEEHDALHIAQWLLCGNCDRVARSIGRSVAAEAYVASVFDELFHDTPLTIVPLDVPILRAHDAQVLERKVASIDFAIYEGQYQIAGIELKTGRNHLGGWAPVGSRIGTFQLDHGDCDDISAVASAENILVYLFHAQVIDRVNAPTTRFEATGLWWIDPFAFSASYQSSRTRPRETKTAAYYSIDGFRPFDEFRGHWESGELANLRQRFDSEGQPPLHGHRA